MNRVVTTDASITAGQPIVANAGLGTLPFMEDGYQEAMANIVKGLLGTYTTNDLIVLIDPLIVITGGGNTATWTAGAIFYNDEIYTIPAGTLTKAGGAVFLYVISDTASLVLDPVNFKDGTVHSPHRVRQITISSGTSGTGIADYNGATVKNIAGSYVVITALNSWVNTGSLAKYKILGNGDVLLTGSIGCNGVNIPSSAIMFTLPVGLRPSTLRTFIMLGADNGSIYGAFRITIATNGNVSFLTAGGGAATFDAFAQAFLNGIRFNIAD